MIPYGRQIITQEDIDAVLETLQSDYLTGGPAVTKFENIVKEYIGVKHAIALSNATSGLHVACLAIGLGQSDVGLTSPISFLASANCIAYCGADPDFIDINSDTLCMCPTKLEEYIKSHGVPKVVIPVDFGGVPADLPSIWSLAKKYNFKVIEDASHSIGSYYVNKNKKIKCGSCTHSDFAIFSFHPVKTVTAGEGGMVLTNNDDLAKKARMFASHGMEREVENFLPWKINNQNGNIESCNDLDLMKDIEKAPWLYQQQELGYNYRITDIQSALGTSQFKRIDSTIKKRKKIFDIYQEAFRDTKDIKTPKEFNNYFCAYHLYVIKYLGCKKDWRINKINELRKNGIFSQIHYIPIYLQPWYKNNFDFSHIDCSNSEEYYSKCISIPLYPDILNEDITKIINIIKSN